MGCRDAEHRPVHLRQNLPGGELGWFPDPSSPVPPSLSEPLRALKPFGSPQQLL